MQLRKLGRRMAATGLAVAVAASLGAAGSASAAPGSENPSGAPAKLERSAAGGASGASLMAEGPASIGSDLRSGRTMSEAQALVSPSEQHVLVTNGYAGEQFVMLLTGYTGDPVVVRAITDPPSNAAVTNSLVMQGDGNLVLYTRYPDGRNVATFATNTFGNPGAYARLQNDRNLVVYSASGRPLWASNSTMTNMTSYYAAADNNEDGWLDPGWTLLSKNRRYELLMQGDGNLVLYGTSPRRAIWASRTNGNPGARATMQVDGNLVVYSAAGRPLWSTGGNGNWQSVAAFNELRLQDDGNLVKYYTADRVYGAKWATNTNGR